MQHDNRDNQPAPGSLLKELDLDKSEFLAFLDAAARLKRATQDGSEAPRPRGSRAGTSP